MLIALALGCVGTQAASPDLSARGAQAVAIVTTGDGIPAPLDGAAGDAARGRALVIARDAANCVLWQCQASTIRCCSSVV